MIIFGNTYVKKIYKINCCFILAFILFGLQSLAQVVSTVAGIQATIGSLNGDALTSTFNNPHGVEVDNNGNIYIADRYNHLIRKCDSNGNVSVLAGSGAVGNADGQGSQASFNEPWGLTVDVLGNVYVADTKNNKIRKISPSGLVTTVAGTGNFGITDSNNPLAASFGNPTGIAVDQFNDIYVGDHLTHLIRKISSTGVVSTFAGNRNYPNNHGLIDGLGQEAKFYRPYGIEVDKSGNVYVADEWNHAIRKISPSGLVTTLAGNGVAGSGNGNSTNASFKFPWDVTTDSLGNVYVADGFNYVIRKINLNLDVTTFAGTMSASGATNGPALQASFNGATSLSLSTNNQFFIVGDAYNQLIRKIELQPNVSVPTIYFASYSEDSVGICQNTNMSIVVNSDYNPYNLIIDGTTVGIYSSDTIVLPNLSSGSHAIQVGGSNPDSYSTALALNVLPNNLLSLNVFPTGNLCEGDSAIISTSDNSFVTWSTGQTDNSITTYSSGAYYISSVNTQCSSFNDTVNLVFHSLPSPLITVLSGTSINVGDTVTLVASGAVQYVWSNQVVGDQIIVTESGDYTVKGTNVHGCSAESDSTSINFQPVIPPQINFNSNLTDTLVICEGNSVEINLSGSFSYYEVMVDGSIQMNIVSNSFILTNLIPGQHLIDVVGINENLYESASNVLFVTVLSNHLISLSANISSNLCLGDSVVITTSNNEIITWNTGETNDSVIVYNSGLYYTALISTQCTISTDTVELQFHSLPNPFIDQSGPTSIFIGDTVVLTSSEDANFVWSNGEVGNQIEVTESGQYSVLATNTFGCSASSDTISLFFQAPPDGIDVYSPNGTSLCVGDSIPLYVSVFNNFQWIKDGELLNKFDSILFVTETGSYSYQFEFSPGHLVIASPIYIEANPSLDIDFTYEKKYTSTESIKFEFYSTIINCQYYTWNIDSVYISDQPYLNYDFTASKTYNVKLFAINQFGCSSSIEKEILVNLETDLFIPTAFTPNNDGINDIARIRGVSVNDQISFLIFNEWGEQVFYSSSVDIGWDGTYKGQACNIGNYSYLLNVNKNKTSQSYSGIITLIK
jgi:gliding motility-associated-like protein